MHNFFLLLEQLHVQLRKDANHAYGLKQQAYVKSTLPLYGLPKPQSADIAKKLFVQYKPTDNKMYRDFVCGFFTNSTHRDIWYAGLEYARMFKKFITGENIDLYIDLVRITQWWDIVDTIAPHLIGKALDNNATLLQFYTQQWIVDPNMWVRRTALLTQLMYKKDTNFNLQADLILCVANQKEFFIRKAIGWSLRQYSKTNPADVYNFITAHQKKLSPLSVKEGIKYCTKAV